jgi:hypothetical protein
MLSTRARRLVTRNSSIIAAAVTLGALANPAHAWLGGFEPADGYQGFLNQVQIYNAGQYGPNSGYMAMSPTPITPNSGLWTAISGGSGLAYATGHFATDRQYINSGLGSINDQGLVITTHDQGWGGPAQRYKYNVDSQDLGGVSPPSTAGTKVQISFWTKGGLPGDPTGVNGVPYGYFGNSVEFADGAGNIGFRVGLTHVPGGNSITFWNGSTMFQSPMVHFGSKYDQWTVTLDLATQTVTADYYNFIFNTTTNMVSGAPLITGMSDFSSMYFQSSPGVNNQKNWSIDDFGFRAVPAPGTAGMLGLGALLLGRRRR